MKDTLGAWGSAITERMTNPIIASFVISWSIYNWKFWILLFSKNKASETFDMVSAMYDDKFFGYQVCCEWAFHGFGAPLLLAILYLALVPPLTAWYYVQVKSTHERVETARGAIQRWLDPEKADQLRQQYADMKAKFMAEESNNGRLRDDLASTRKLYGEEKEAARVAAEAHAENIKSMQTQIDSAITLAQVSETAIVEQRALRAIADQARRAPILAGGFRESESLHQGQLDVLNAMDTLESRSLSFRAAKEASSQSDDGKVYEFMAKLEDLGLVSSVLDGASPKFTLTEKGTDLLAYRLALDRALAERRDAQNNAAHLEQTNVIDLKARILALAINSPSHGLPLDIAIETFANEPHDHVEQAIRQLLDERLIAADNTRIGGGYVITPMGEQQATSGSYFEKQIAALNRLGS